MRRKVKNKNLEREKVELRRFGEVEDERERVEKDEGKVRQLKVVVDIPGDRDFVVFWATFCVLGRWYSHAMSGRRGLG